MVVHLITLLYASFLLEVCPFFWDILSDTFYENPVLFLSIFALTFLLNFYILSWKESFNNNSDILYKFFNFCFRAVSIFFTLLLSEIKRFFYFLKNFKHRESYITFKFLIAMRIAFIFIIWRPLFKKWSYFGFYKSNRSKWWKNK